MELIIGIIGFVCLIIFFVMASNLGTIAKSSKNSEAILKRLLEIEKERENMAKRAEQTRTGTDEFMKYKAKI